MSEDNGNQSAGMNAEDNYVSDEERTVSEHGDWMLEGFVWEDE